MKKIVQFIVKIIGVILLVKSFVELYSYMKNNGFFDIINGITKLREEPSKLVELSAYKNKYMGIKATSTMDEFVDLLKKRGFVFVARYGKADIYRVGGVEILVKRTIMLNRYYVFDIFDEKNLLK